jgi:antirestriction protein ArdC
MAQAALNRAQNGETCANDLLIIAEYAARGVDAHPRVDVFTYSAWQALDRHVKKGEHGVHVAAYATRIEEKPDGTQEEHSFPTSATVFHISQTEPNTQEATT